jgi:hypothetical protein
MGIPRSKHINKKGKMENRRQQIKRYGLLRAIAITLLTITPKTMATIIADDFNDGSIDPSWQVIEQSGSAYVTEEGGYLRLGGGSGVTGRITLQHTATVDIEESVWIDYDWIQCTDHKARWGIGVFDQWLNTGMYISLVPNNFGASEHWVGIYTYQDGVSNTVYSAEPWPLEGRLQIILDDSQLIPQYWSHDQNDWVNFDIDPFNADFNNNDTYVFMHSSNSDYNPEWEIALDNFSVPEPSTLLLFGIGSMMILRRKR